MIEGEKREKICKELEELINRNSLENGSNTPDYLLANYLISCLDTWDILTVQRDRHYNVNVIV